MSLETKFSAANREAWTVGQRVAHGVNALQQRFEQIERLRTARRLAESSVLTEEHIAQWTRSASMRDCETVGDLVACELCRRGLRCVCVGSRTYCRVEAHIVTDIVTRELDLDEIAASIEEARWERSLS